jgi:sodium-coupled neutral amino acid transporter 11
MSKEKDEESDIKVSKGEEIISESESQSTILGATFNMSKTIVGSGIFAFPLAYQRAGLFAATFLILAILTVMSWTTGLIVSLGISQKVYSSHGLLKKCFGTFGSIIFATFCFLFSFGSIAAYTVIIGDSIPIIIRAIAGSTDKSVKMAGILNILSDRRVVTASILFGILLPLSLIRNIHKLAKFSGFALSCIIVISILVVVAGVNLPTSERGASENLWTIVDWNGVLPAIGTICFAFITQHVF